MTERPARAAYPRKRAARNIGVPARVRVLRHARRPTRQILRVHTDRYEMGGSAEQRAVSAREGAERDETRRREAWPCIPRARLHVSIMTGRGRDRRSLCATV
ncbi:MAG: hypothetical protein ACXWQ8_08880 [Ktedonobacterales bacterium]